MLEINKSILQIHEVLFKTGTHGSASKTPAYLAKRKLLYLAQHTVPKAESDTTKCRVVFDGSGKGITA